MPDDPYRDMLLARTAEYRRTTGDPVVAAVLAEADVDDARAAAAAATVRLQAGPAVADAAQLFASNERTPASPKVRAMANRAGVDLSTLIGTGAGGRIRAEDVMAARPTAPVGPVTAATGRTGRAVTARYPDPDPVDFNPRASYSGWLEAARRAGPEPTLFATGNLPPFTASGIDVDELLGVPWPARPAMATARTRSAALAISENVHDVGAQSGHTHLSTSPVPDAADVALAEYGDHEVVRAYLDAVDQWLFNGQRAG